MNVVSNSTPIISLAKVNQVSLLHRLFEKVCIPRAVYQEIKTKEAPGFREIDADYFQITEIKGSMYLGFLLNEVDAGEAEAIVLARELDAEALIIDERAGYAIAKSQGINAIGTLTVLLMAKQEGLIGLVQPILDELIAKGSWYSKHIYHTFLKQIDEL